VGTELAIPEGEEVELRKNDKDELSLVLNRQGAA
jgi:hypothetical protein